MDELKVGDVVSLKSGGPKMTIDLIDTFGDSHKKARCMWFERGKREVDVFELATLVRIGA